MRKLITTSRALSLRPPMPVSRGFARFLGRPLTRAERIVISRLERTSPGAPVLIVDPPGHDSSLILRRYLCYRMTLATPHTLGVIYEGATRTSVTRLQNGKELWNLSTRNPSRIRGCNPEFVLLLNVQNFRRHSPFRGRGGNFWQLCQALFPYAGSGLIILHYQDSAKGRSFPLQLHRITPATHARIIVRNATTYIIIPFSPYTSPNPPLLQSTREGPPSALVRILRCAGLRPTTGHRLLQFLPLCNRPARAL